MIVANKEINMIIIPCLYGDGLTDSTEIRRGAEIEVGQIPKIGETIKLKMNLFDLIFKNVYSDYKDNIIFHNNITTGIVKEVVHSFHVVTREKPKLFPGKKSKPEFCSAIQSANDVEIEQTVFVVIDFDNR